MDGDEHDSNNSSPTILFTAGPSGEESMRKHACHDEETDKVSGGMTVASELW